MKFRFAVICVLSLFYTVVNGQILINEFMAANSSAVTDPDNGNTADWIEIYNASDTDMDIGGFYLTDNLSDTTRWMIPSGTIIATHSFLVFWCDATNIELHTSFSLSSVGEELGIYSNDLVLLDGFSFTTQETDISYGRTTDGSNSWSWFSEATPAATNNGSIPYIGVTHFQAAFSQNGGFFSAPINIGMNTLGGTIHYTLDGRAPTLDDPQYTTPIPVNQSSFIRARVFEENKIPGPIVTHSYFYETTFEERRLPVISLVTDPDYFWDADTGIYVQDFKPEWEWPLNIEFFENDGNNQAVFNQQAGVKINGLWSWQLPQKMLGIYFGKEYGSASLDYPVFPEKERASYNELILRAGGSDWSYTLFRDGLGQSVTQENGPVHNQGFRYCIVFINGEYMGIHSLRSRTDGADIEQTYGIEESEYDIIANDGEIEEGDAVNYQLMDDLINTDLTVTANYEALTEMLDIQNITDYFITEIYSSNNSWGHNVKLWKPKNGGKWQFIYGDLDRGFTGSTDNGINEFSVPVGDGYDYGRQWMQHLFLNESYADYFAQRFADYLHTSLHPTKVNKLIDQFAFPIIPEIPYHVNRWAGTTSNYGNGISTVQFWEDQVNEVRAFADVRQSFLMSDLQTKFGLDEIVKLSTSSNPTNGGDIHINDFKIPGSPWSGPYFNSMPFQLSAVPRPGFNFQGWTTMESSLVFDLGSEWKYLDNGSDQGTAWTAPTFDDGAWSSGNAQLGYGDGDEATVVSYGPNASAKYPTTYFRKTFTYDGDNSSPMNCVLNIVRDDGVVVYLNGNEVLRNNMPNGDINYQTYAASTISGANESATNSFTLSLPLINGENIIAVEIHQIDSVSSDISFDASLAVMVPGTAIISTDSILDVTLNGDAAYVAMYVPNGQCILPDSILVNTVLTIDCSPYVAQGDVIVESSVSLSVDPGVEIWFPESARLIVKGDLQVNGTENSPVLLKENTQYGASSWGNVTFDHSTAVNHLNYLELRNATEGEHPIHHRAAISGWFSDIEMDHVTLMENFSNPIFGEYSSFRLTNSEIHSDVTGDLINVKYGDGYISDCVFTGNDQVDTDAIDYDLVTNGVIRNSIIQNFFGGNSDAIDLGEACVDALVENCLLNNCTDKGISCGQSSTATIRNTTIVNCNLGFGVKDLGVISAEHITFYSDVYGVSVYEKNPGLGGGTVSITNSIFSNCSSTPVYHDTWSEVTVTNSFYDTDTMAYSSCTWMNPLFINPTNYNFHLQNDSPALSAGTDGLDLGTLDHRFSSLPNVMISEIQYWHPDSADIEYIRILNSGDDLVDISGYYLSMACDFTFPANTWLAPGEEVMVVKDITLFPDATGLVFQWTDGKLNNEGETILLSESHGILIDYVSYDDATPWPMLLPTNPYIELISADLDNHFASSWQAASVSPNVQEAAQSLFGIYPNPAQDRIMLQGDVTVTSIEIVDMTGRQALFESNGSGLRLIDITSLSDGIYTVIINQEYAQKLVVKN